MGVEAKLFQLDIPERSDKVKLKDPNPEREASFF